MLPRLQDGVIVLDHFTAADVSAHLAGEDEETARRFGWWPESSTEETVRAAYERWARNWAESGPVRAFAVRDLSLLLAFAASIGVTSVESQVAADSLASRRVSEKAGLAPAGMFTSDEGTLMVRYRTGSAPGSSASAPDSCAAASYPADPDDPTSDQAERMG